MLNVNPRFGRAFRPLYKTNSGDPYSSREGDLSSYKARPSIFTEWNKVGQWSVALITSRGVEDMGMQFLQLAPKKKESAAEAPPNALDVGFGEQARLERLEYADLAPGETIRLLTLHPGEYGHPLHMSLSHHNISNSRDVPSFSALSYVWGDPKQPRPAFCDGRTIGITRNLFGCLQRLRRPDAARLLWIDAICINQRDLEERAAQVGIMGEIYAKADKVLIWLGEGNEHTREGVYALESMAKAWSPPPDQPISFSTVLKFARSSRIRTLDYWALGRQQKIRSITNSAWFTRAWTFQEVGLSSDAEVWIGDHNLPWKTLVYAWLLSLHMNFERTLFLNGYGRTVDTGRTCMHAMFAYWYLQNHGNSKEVREWCQLYRLLRLRQLHEASDPRDLIFSLLSLSRTDNGENFKPNYKLSVEDVFTQAAAQTIRESRDISLLSERERRGADLELPSWVPDWRSPPIINPLNSLLPSAWREYRVGQGRPQDERLGSIEISDGKTLRLAATHIDSVRVSHSVSLEVLKLPAEMRSLDWSETTKVLWYYIRTRLGCEYDSSYAPTREPMIIALLRTLSGDNFPTSPALEPDEAAHRFPLHYSFMRNPQWLTLRGHLLRKLRVWDYEVPQTHGMKLGGAPESIKHGLRAAQGPEALLPYLPSLLRKWITQSGTSIGKCPYIGPIPRGNSAINQDVTNSVYVKMIRTRMRRHWFSYVPFLPSWAQQKARVLYKAVGYVRLDLHRSELLLELVANIDKTIRGRRLLVTEKGYVGLGSLDVQAGDQISLLGNSPVPYLVRKCGEEPVTYRLVGKDKEVSDEGGLKVVERVPWLTANATKSSNQIVFKTLLKQALMSDAMTTRAGCNGRAGAKRTQKGRCTVSHTLSSARVAINDSVGSMEVEVQELQKTLTSGTFLVDQEQIFPGMENCLNTQLSKV
ncbi:hypothetical protein EPUS_09347 [Endocarpon pusillum Z07020]|uniref:Heterokaryon incompatibility domain-containing protein n=1 Tax=Endocarpon pusillum (strain Z07020 / HMAS-L-300199) TaxID=1263415 RepID=U1FXV4_ENDPU|nr:uncharacterized protein EPUS_09347 [Endocarpon pusillum Z07020]ERF69727.1 hypothetical protein EPUS_09347 [Endocarpon pusillum Z07020]